MGCKKKGWSKNQFQELFAGVGEFQYINLNKEGLSEVIWSFL